MHRLAFLMLLAALLSPLVQAQEPKDPIACFHYRKDNAPYKKKLWDGYEISLGPSRNPDAVEDKCTAAVYNAAGKAVFRTSGFSVVFDEQVTGKDFDADGKPEVVFRTDSGGGMHCCWAYIVFSLSPKPHKLFEIDMQGRVDFEKDKEGKMLIWQMSGGPMEFTSMAGRPFGEKVLRVQNGKLIDSTPEFCGTKDKRLETREPSANDLKKLAQGSEPGSEMEEVVSALESRTIQHVFCHEFDEALKDLNLWPSGKREIVMKSFAEGTAQDYPEFAARLQEILKNK